MSNHASVRVAIVLIALFSPISSFSQQLEARDLLWQDRGNISELDLLGGPGGTDHQPGTHFKFLKESMSGTAPKFEVEDENGIKWKVKLGPEVKAETAATRLVWAAGYFVDEDYYRPEIQVDGLKRLSRGQNYVRDGNTVIGARLERHHGGPDEAEWSWFDNAFMGTREFNGLRVMMALINNWDLKDINNAVYSGPNNNIYVVADLGAALGRTGNTFRRSKGNAKDYASTSFVRKVSGQYVDLVLHSRPFLLTFIANLRYYRMRTKMETLTKHIPIDDARWVGSQLGHLSSNQISDCFRAGGFSPTEVNTYTRVVVQRIAVLNQL
jgi:hypothetical protein